MVRPRELAHVFVWVRRHLAKAYHEPEVETLRPLLAPTDVCIDLGAHAGAWAVPLSRLVPQGRVYAFEVFPYYARVLRATVSLLRRSNIEVVGKAVLDEAGTVEVVWRDPTGNRLTGLTHVAGTDEQGADTVVCDGITLDDFFADKPGAVRFIKMDIEGAELLALRGGSQLIDRHRPLVYTELKAEHCARYGYTPDSVFTYFEERDYHGFMADSGDAYQAVDAARYARADTGNLWFVPREHASAFAQ